MAGSDLLQPPDVSSVPSAAVAAEASAPLWEEPPDEAGAAELLQQATQGSTLWASEGAEDTHTHTYKNHAEQYLAELLQVHNPVGALRSSHKLLLEEPDPG